MPGRFAIDSYPTGINMSEPYRPRPTRALENRYSRTLAFLLETAVPPGRVLDLGAPNPLADRVAGHGFVVHHTDKDLDLHPDSVKGHEVDFVTAFEILEHLVAPYNVLRALPADRLFATVPLRLWFASAYRNPTDEWDRHYHEFEDWQFDWLLQKAGWTVVRRQKWTSPTGQLGFRPLLRRFANRYYAVEAVRDHTTSGLDEK